MKVLSKTVLLLAAVTVVAFVSAPLATRAAAAADDQENKGRRVDVEAGFGVLWGLSGNVHVDDNVSYGATVAVELSDRLDLEFGFQRVDTHVQSDATKFPDDAQTVEYFKTGLRLYPSTKPDARVRPYLLGGVARYSGLDPGDSRFGLILGPGVRMRAGDHSGVVLSLPIVTALSGDTKPVMMPNLNVFWSFNFAQGGLTH